jgi:hypothetical protein
MKCTDATKFHRKSGVAKWRDLQFSGPPVEMFSTERTCDAARDKTARALFCNRKAHEVHQRPSTSLRFPTLRERTKKPLEAVFHRLGRRRRPMPPSVWARHETEVL